MWIHNEKKLLDNARNSKIRKLRRDAISILNSCLDAVDPKKAILNKLKLQNNKLSFDDFEIDLSKFSRIFVVGGGKASGAMSEAVEKLLGERISKGIVNVVKGTEDKHQLDRIRLNGAHHPIPDEEGLHGAKRILLLIDKADAKDLVIVVISGGGSALLTYPANGIRLEGLKSLTDMLLKSGATINEINAVRKHLSAVKGGQLALRAYPATVISLILSDVVGDSLDTIASGPTTPDESTFGDAIHVLRKYGLWKKIDYSIRQRLEAGEKGMIAETPKPGQEIFGKVFNLIVGSNLDAAKEAIQKAEDFGYNTMLLSTRIEGEAKHVGRVYAAIVKEVSYSNNPIHMPAAIIAGGETTVTVKGLGRGGRNQELALSASIEIEGYEAVITSLATDGIDGPTDAAGAIIDGYTIKRAKSIGLSPEKFLLDNNSNEFFSKLEDTIMTGPTETNVNDLAIILVDS